MTGRAVTIGRRILLPNGPAATFTEVDNSGPDFDGLPIIERTRGTVESLPDESTDSDSQVLYLVHPAVQAALPHRKDLAALEEGREGPSIYRLLHSESL
ncbi:MAG: hypothetical protein ACKVHP_02950 [Verrucomicrobiales bacterium]